MSELIIVRDTCFRRNLLATASALTLIGYIAATGTAKAEDPVHSAVWIELGGQLERVNEAGQRFTAPFLEKPSVVYDPVSPIEAQRASRYAYGGEGKLIFEPEGTDWRFSAAVKYGRSNSGRNVNKQTYHRNKTVAIGTFTAHPSKTFFQLAHTEAHNRASHLILDFQAGKDVGLGILGGKVDFGVRYAQFTAQTDAHIRARPNLQYYPKYGMPPSWYVPRAKFHQYQLDASAERSFHGIGPSLSWEGSAPFAGDKEDAQFTVDWGINGALLFGRQKARIDHHTSDRYFRQQVYNFPHPTFYTHYKPTPVVNSGHPVRSRSVVVPNLGGFAGMSLKFLNAKVSLGYRADFFFGAMDGGIDARKTYDRNFYGPFATIGIGL